MNPFGLPPPLRFPGIRCLCVKKLETIMLGSLLSAEPPSEQVKAKKQTRQEQREKRCCSFDHSEIWQHPGGEMQASRKTGQNCQKGTVLGKIQQHLSDR